MAAREKALDQTDLLRRDRAARQRERLPGTSLLDAAGPGGPARSLRGQIKFFDDDIGPRQHIAEAPPLRIMGTVHLAPGTAPEALLERTNEMFVPVVGGVAYVGERPVSEPQVDAILVNRFYLRGVKETGQVIDLIKRVRERGLPVILISHDMPHVFELADRIHIMRLGRRVAVVTPKTHTMPEAVAIMTGATPSLLDKALTKEGSAE